MKITWDPPTKSIGYITRYKLVYFEEGTEGPSEHDVEVNGHSHTLTALKIYHQYSFRVSVVGGGVRYVSRAGWVVQWTAGCGVMNSSYRREVSEYYFQKYLHNNSGKHLQCQYVGSYYSFPIMHRTVSVPLLHNFASLQVLAYNSNGPGENTEEVTVRSYSDGTCFHVYLK